MDIFDDIADERRALADRFAGLSAAQLATPSLCGEWTIHEVLGHLIVPLEVTLPRFALAIAAARGRFDVANVRLARKQAQRPLDEIVDVLRRKAESRFTPPGHGAEAPLTDLLVHGLDMGWPLGIDYDIPHHRMLTSLQFTADAGAGVIVPKGTLDGLSFEATDIDWTHGTGQLVSGSAQAVLLAVSGRRAALAHLTGPGAQTLALRLT